MRDYCYCGCGFKDSYFSENLDILFKRNQATAAVKKEEKAKILILQNPPEGRKILRPKTPQNLDVVLEAKEVVLGNDLVLLNPETGEEEEETRQTQDLKESSSTLTKATSFNVTSPSRSKHPLVLLS